MSAGRHPGSEYCNRTATCLAKGSLRVAFWGLQRPSLRAHVPANREQMMWPRAHISCGSSPGTSARRAEKPFAIDVPVGRIYRSGTPLTEAYVPSLCEFEESEVPLADRTVAVMTSTRRPGG